MEPPTRGRYKVLAFLCVLALILYIDRVCISKAATAMQAELGIGNTEMGVVFAAFTAAYCLFEVPTGSWGDRFGSRGVMTRIVLWWSAFTALTGAAPSLWPLIGIRFFFGAGEAGAFPNTARILARWFPAGQRGSAQGMINTTALVGAAVSPVAAAYLIEWAGWRWAFFLFALPGVAWALAFYRWYRDDPATHPAVNEAERQLIGTAAHKPGHAHHPPIPWRLVLTSANVWLLGGVVACAAFNTYLFFSWYPVYLEKGRGLDNRPAGWLASIALAGGAVGATTGGFVIDALIRRTGNRRTSRRALGATALTLAAVCLVAGIHTDDAFIAALWASTAMFAINGVIASWWGAVADISGRHLGALFGLMNSMGGVGAIASQLFLGSFADWMKALGYEGRAQWDPAFYLYAGVLLLGAAGWLAIDSTRPVEPPSHDTLEDGPEAMNPGRT